ncbi:MAG TPA: hypothetical protein VNX40_12355, partial [Mucilaginibacter sp.]|nr:hypothetical protein [Mucilaginibacter sp.]
CCFYYIPCLTNKTALELDDEKLQFNIKGFLKLQKMRDIIYWKDINDLDYFSNRHTGAIIVLKMNDGSDTSGMSLKWVSGNDKEIYQTITAYFEKYK